MFDFDTIIDRHATNSEKWDRYAGQDIIPLWVADMDFRSPPAVLEALHQRVEHGVFGYSSPPQELLDVVLAMLQREYRWEVQPEWLVWLPGLVCGLNVACRAVGTPGDAVATFTPVYPPFLTAPGLAGRELISVPLVEQQGRWEMDLEALEQAITPRTRLLMLCSPHNPVGRVWSRDEQLALAALAERHNLIVCSDEIHAGLVLESATPHVPFAILAPELAQRTITLLAPSKTWNIPGLGCSFAVIPDKQLRQSFRGVMAGIVPHVNLLGYTATLAAYRDGDPWRQALLGYLRQNRDLVLEAIQVMPGLKTWPVEATYLSWIDARGLGVADPARFFEQAGVGLSDGVPFGAPGFVRLNFGCPRSLLQQALERMKTVCVRKRGLAKD
ncbi:MAG: pyridoxal phosphate-dependent aminotransferase [Trichlorobacter sp.]|uniref:MalY/PatB family protein n=1 Tax=Trichlorobacter sp. TaxID=2911007 RepID=UPI00256BA872|nr:pyridoxal phosphate-dependent aminotransferase [Trichlorobacter sp.]MDK9716315.1 pyridoxal phosphate-dependent aminotransferase [Trichlorobacter sp.]